MKKTALKILLYLLVCFLMPFVMTMIMNGISGTANKSLKAGAALLWDDDAETNYITGTVSELYKADDGTEIVKALVVMARTNMEYEKLNGAGSISAASAPKISDDTYNVIKDAMKATEGIIMKKDGEVFYAEYYQDMQTFTMSQDQLIKLLKKHEDCEFSNNFMEDFQIIERDKDGSVKELMVGSVVMEGKRFAEITGLKSTSFTVSQKGENVIFTINGSNDGMSVSRARALAAEGKSYNEILMEFFKNIEFVRSQ